MKAALLALLIFLLSDCIGQTPPANGKKLYYDTVALPLPKPTKEDVATPGDYKHCIDLTHDGYIIVINGQKYIKPNIQEVSSFVKANRPTIIKRKINIISDSATDYEKIMNALDLMTEAKIDNYKLVSVNGKLPPSSPIVIQSTRPFTKDIDLNDSTVLIISIASNYFETSLLNKRATQKLISDLDKFIADNKGKIDPDKIVITAAGDLPYKVIDPVISVLNKNEYHHYHIIAKN